MMPVRSSFLIFLCVFLGLHHMSVVSAQFVNYESYRTTVDRLPPLTASANPWRVSNDLRIPQLYIPLSYGPFGVNTQLPRECFLYTRGSPDPGEVESERPLHPDAWPRSVNRTGATSSSPRWYGFFCVTEASRLNKADGTTFSFLRDIRPYLDAKNSTWSQRVSWGLRGFAYYLCRNIDDKWITLNAKRETVYDRFVPESGRDPDYVCDESYLGFFHQGLPMPPNYPDPVTYVIPNPHIEYYCVNHTVFFPFGNNPNDDLTDVDGQETEPYTKYTLECFARDEFANRYLDDFSNAYNGGVGLPQTLTCSDISATGSMLKMVEACSMSFVVPAVPRATNGPPATVTAAAGSGFRCLVQCRYPCITQTEYMTYQSQTASSLCLPTARNSQCNRDVRSIAHQFCEPTETLSAFQIAPNRGLNTFENDIISECSIGSLGCRVQCHCKGERGCPNHVRCNGHGTLYDTSIESHPPLTPTCMCEPGRKGDTCEIAVSHVICNHGQEL